MSILFTGDFVPPSSCDNIFTNELTEVLREKDFSIINLEAPLTDSNSKTRKTGHRNIY